MKNKKQFIIYPLLAFLLIFGLWINKPSGRDILLEANSNLQKQDSYMIAKFKSNSIGDLVETKVSFQPYLLNKENLFGVGCYTEHTLAIPFLATNFEEFKEHIPTLVVQRKPTETGYIEREYINITEEFINDLKEQMNSDTSNKDTSDEEKELGLESGFIFYKENKVVKPDAFFSKEDIFNTLEESRIQYPVLDSEGNEIDVEKEEKPYGLLVSTYTGGMYNLNVFIDSIQNIQMEKIKYNDRNYFKITGHIVGHPYETYLLYKEADIEIWIDKVTKLPYKEIYKFTGKNNKKDFENVTSFEYGMYNNVVVPEFPEEIDKLETKDLTSLLLDIVKYYQNEFPNFNNNKFLNK